MTDRPKHIPLTKGYMALVDAEDYERVSQYIWSASVSKSGYARAVRGDRLGKIILMHREIMCAPQGLDVDHINGNSLDNRKANLRLCTHRQNLRNMRKPSHARSSKYKGVCWSKRRGKFISYIHGAEGRIHLGYYPDEIDAAKAYNEAAIKYHGDFAMLNIMPTEVGEDERSRSNPVDTE